MKDSERLQRQREFDEDVRQNFQWNFIVNLLYGLFGTTGWRLIMAPTFVPDYMYKLGGSNTIVGLLLFCGGFSRFLTPLIMASMVEHLPLIKKKAVLIGTLMRSQVFLMAMIGFFLVGQTNIIAFFICFSLFNMFLGMQNVVYNTVMSKVIPADRRGRFIGLRNFLGGFTVAVVALAAGSLMDRLDFPRDYAATYLLAFVLTCIGLIFFALSREPVTPVVRKKSPSLERIRGIPAQLRGEPNFARYLLCCVVGALALMSMPFLTLYAQTNLSLSSYQIGQLTSVFFAAQTLLSLVLGLLADRSGFKLVFVVATGAWALAMVALITMPITYPLAVGVFVAFGGGVGGFRMSVNNMVLEFGDTASRPMRIAIVNSSVELANAIGPLLAGFLADNVSYRSVFMVSILCTTSALIMMYSRVTEPRHNPHRTI